MTHDLLEHLLPALALDGSRRLYVVLTSDGLPQQFRHRHLRGFYAQSADLALMPWLKEQGRWQGRGAAIVVDDLAIDEDLRPDTDGDEAFHAEILKQRITCIAVHEYAHAVQYPASNLDVMPSVEVSAELTTILASKVASPPKENITRAPFAFHDAVWLRILLHAVHRAEQLGIYLPLSQVIGDWWQYATSSPWGYSARLLEEFDSLATVPLAELDQHAPPPGFAELWRDDVTRWFNENRQCEGQLFTDVVDALSYHNQLITK